MDKEMPAPTAKVLQTLGVTLVAPGPLRRPEEALKTGGFKTVFAATLNATGEEVVVTVEATQQLSKDAFETYAAEQAAISRVATEPSHPNLVAMKAPPLLCDGKLFMVLERCQQEVFDVLIDAGAPKTGVVDHVARDFLVQAAAGLLHMHNLGVAHRDVKLENMLLTKEGVLKLIDFGLAHVAQVPEDPFAPFDMTGDRDVGSRAYTAPEVRAATKGTPYSCAAADVWSLGVCLFALVTGYWPLREASTADWRFRKLCEAQARGTSSCEVIFSWYKRSTSGMTAELIELLDSMLLIDPQARPSITKVLKASWLKGGGEQVLEAQHCYKNDVTSARQQPCSPAKDTPLDEADENLAVAAATLSMQIPPLPPNLRNGDDEHSGLYRDSAVRAHDEPVYRGLGTECHSEIDDDEPSYRSISIGFLDSSHSYMHAGPDGVHDEYGGSEDEWRCDTGPPTVVRQAAKGRQQ